MPCSLSASDHRSPAKEHDPMNATMTREAFPSVPFRSVPRESGSVSGTPLTLLRLEGAAALAGATLAYAALGGRWPMFALLFLVPDLSMLGYLLGRRLGAACYNAGHSYLGPAALAALGASLNAHKRASDMPLDLLLCFACIWAAHVGFDRLLGYGLKYGTNFGDTHLGRRGRADRAEEPGKVRL
jgi:Domain of unknown function (DUF4260)